MKAYELMIKTNHYLIKDGILTAVQKENIVRELLAACSNKHNNHRFYKNMVLHKAIYPVYYILPYSKNKLQTVIPMSPKTYILAANAYELDILRLLYLLAPENQVVLEMIKITLERLASTCFGGTCIQGECFHSSLPVIRFLATVSLHDDDWIKRLITKVNNHINEKYKRNSVKYYWLCLSELPYDMAKPGLLKYKDEIYSLIKKSVPLNTAHSKLYQPVLYYIYRNCLSVFSEYAYIKDRHPYISEKDGRLHFNMNH